MTANLDWLRPSYDAFRERQWEEVKLAYRLYPQLVELGAVEVGQAVLNLVGQGAATQIKVLDLRYRTYPRAVCDRRRPSDRRLSRSCL